MTNLITNQDLVDALRNIESKDLVLARSYMDPEPPRVLCVDENHPGYGGMIECCTHNECIVRTVLER